MSDSDEALRMWESLGFGDRHEATLHHSWWWNVQACFVVSEHISLAGIEHLARSVVFPFLPPNPGRGVEDRGAGRGGFGQRNWDRLLGWTWPVTPFWSANSCKFHESVVFRKYSLLSVQGFEGVVGHRLPLFPMFIGYAQPRSAYAPPMPWGFSKHKDRRWRSPHVSGARRVI